MMNNGVQSKASTKQYGGVGMLLYGLSLFASMTKAFAFTDMRSNSMMQRYRTSPEGSTILHYSDSNNNDGAIKKAYNDNALFNFHMMTQAQKIRDYSAMDTFVDTQSLWNLAWHDSFVRNGLADFVPPMTGELGVLVVGGQNQRSRQMIVGEMNSLDGDIAASLEEIEAKLKVVEQEPSSMNQLHQDSSCSFLASVFDNESSEISSQHAEDATDPLEFVTYDCIMDEGLIADLVRPTTDSNMDKENKRSVARLLLQATKRIRESGIYVANTQPMTVEAKEYLQMLGEMLGLQWEFELDGISDGNASVSVARKFGSCPEIGWQTLAKLLKE